MKGFSAGRHKAATALMHAALSNEPIPTMGPPLPPEYVSLQFETLGVTALTDFLSLQTCRPARYPSLTLPTFPIVDTSPFPETDAPAPSVISSFSAPASQDDKTHDKWHRDRWRLIESASKSDDLRLPKDKSKFRNWERIFVSEVRGAAWSSNSRSILQHATTTSANTAASKDLASLLSTNVPSEAATPSTMSFLGGQAMISCIMTKGSSCGPTSRRYTTLQALVGSGTASMIGCPSTITKANLLLLWPTASSTLRNN
jgi:hypothetical protein